MKKLLTICALLLLTITTFAQKINADDIVGTWLTNNDKAKIKITKEGTVYNGEIIWLKTPLNEEGKPKVDKHNPDKAQQNNPIIGLHLIKNFIFDTDKWTGGTIYDPENGKTYSCKITLREGKLDVRGYIGISLIGRTETWFRISK